MPAESPQGSAVISNRKQSPELNTTGASAAGNARFQQPLLALSHAVLYCWHSGPGPALPLLFLLSPLQASSTELQAAGREERSPRRCVRLLESCLGHQIPCCDPCATCYCRFFNAFCYCRKISTNLPCGKN